MRLAVILPTLDEQDHVAGAVQQARRELRDGDLLFVTDGGSADSTVDRAIAAGAEVVHGPAGRGPQLDLGAQAAITRGADILLFLHADTRLPAGWRNAIEQAAPQVGGGFLVEFDGTSPLLRLGALLVNWRTRRLHWPLGDQAQFATTKAYRAAGGFPSWPILEDTELLRRLKGLGPLDIVPLAVRTDSRRFRRRGVVRTVALNWTIWLAYRCGVSPVRLSRWYRHVR